MILCGRGHPGASLLREAKQVVRAALALLKVEAISFCYAKNFSMHILQWLFFMLASKYAKRNGDKLKYIGLGAFFFREEF